MSGRPETLTDFQLNGPPGMARAIAEVIGGIGNGPPVTLAINGVEIGSFHVTECTWSPGSDDEPAWGHVRMTRERNGQHG